jgi:Ca-activated chloride channel family protein
MISFTSPWVLALLVVPVALMAWVWRRQRGRVAMPFDHGEVISPKYWPTVLKMCESLPVLLLSTVIIILAGPQKMGVPQAKRKMTNIQFCVDVSGSMTANFGEATRYDEAMKAINGFLDFREGDAFGLTFFGNAFIHWVPLTTDASAIKCAPPFMHPNKPSRPNWFSGTEVGRALKACHEELMSRADGDRLIILISDGQSGDLMGGQAEAIAEQLKKDNIIVHDIHIANETVPAEISTIAMITGGAVFNPTDPETLLSVFEKIDQMQPVEMERTVGEMMDDFSPFCLVALCIAGLFQVSLLGWRYNPW